MSEHVELLKFVGASALDIASAARVLIVPPGCRSAAGEAFRNWCVVEAHRGADVAGLGVEALRGRLVRVLSNRRGWIDTICSAVHAVGCDVSSFDLADEAAGGAGHVAALEPADAFDALAKRRVLRLLVDKCAPWSPPAVSSVSKTGQPPTLNTALAEAFLKHLFPTAKTHVFQTFTDDKAARRAKPSDNLAHEKIGSLEAHAETISRLMERGAGVYFAVNETEGRHRKAANVTQTRNVIILDLDGTPLSEVEKLGLTPHAIVETSPGRYAVYWRVNDLPLPEFVPLVRRLAVALGGDKSVATVERVMRLPGSQHQKATPFPVTWRDGGATRVYTLGEFVDALELVEAARGISASAGTGGPQRAISGAGNAERMSQDHLTRALALILNDEVFADRHDWQTMGHAIHGASGGEGWGRDLFVDWTEHGGHDPAGAETFWQGVDAANVRSGAGFIRKHLERVGGDDCARLLDEMRIAAARDEFADGFEDDGGTPPPQGRGRKTAADKLVAIGRGADLFHTADREGYASVTLATGARMTWPVKSDRFERWLIGEFLKKTRSAPNRDALAQAVGTLAAIADHEGPDFPVHLRTANVGGRIYLDLADAAGHVVEIDATGWRVVANGDVRFVRPSGMLPLPVPVSGGSLADLRKVINVHCDEHFALTSAWLCAAVRGLPPFPLLVLRGEQGSAKTTFARVLRGLIDPNAAPSRNAPKDVQALFIAARNSFVPTFDNLSGVSGDLADALCMLATGGAFAGRKLYSDSEECVSAAARPVILNGIATLTNRPDLADRTITLDLPPITGTRRTEANLWAEFEKLRPALLGALLDAVVLGLQREATATADPDARLADFSRWGAACEGAFAKPGTFARAYAENREAAAVAGVTDDPVAATLQEFMSDRNEWTGTATELLEQLARQPSRSGPRTWPVDAKRLSDALRRLGPQLRVIGLSWEELPRTKKARQIRVAWMPGAAPDPDVKARAERDLPAALDPASAG